jgi:hypothetical protein
MIAKHQLISIFSLMLISTYLFGCGEDQDRFQAMEINASQQSIDSANGDQLAHQLPLELNITAEQRDEYQRILSGLHEELSIESNVQVSPGEGADPNESCDRCGRETGFLPLPDLFITRFIPVEMKELTLGLASWSMDLSEVVEGLSALLGDEAPAEPLFSYRLTLARVDIDSLSENERELAEMGSLVESGSDRVSLTSLSTADTETALSFEHGFAYLLSVVAIESNTKLSSESSAPLMLYCPNAEKDDHADEASSSGCIQLVADLETR